ncbi:nucleotide-binding universal stress UspA family protein [Saonia flava]|uniref:Nucleotide-binding universal stress UspA family protein n=1 Tax=Saonia flava TaxID=523696 RepID=A0A846R2J0_9FLAO|nr:universal stress protein [Saonia flava]NJB72165.1 nucleotide-binding universal stress UspA family protein [Saonia flava]
MKRIVLPTDFSGNANNAIDYAMQLFAEEECVFYLLHTYSPAIYRADYMLHSPGQIGLGDIYQEASMTQLEELSARLKKKFKNDKHKFVEHAAFNLLVDEVNEVVEKENIELIIMGTQGATGAKEIFMGTHTMHVIRKANCPVIAIPPNFAYEKPKEILFPTDYEVDYQKEHIKQLLYMAKEHISRINVMYVHSGYDLTEDQLAKKNKLEKLLRNTSYLFHEMPDQEVVSAINNFQLKTKINLLVMIQNQHGFFENLFLKSVIKQIGFHTNVPFMVFPPIIKN